MTAAAIIVVAALAISEAVQVELIQLAGTAIAAGAAITAAIVSRRNRRELHELYEQQARRREEVRDPNTEHVLVLERPADPPPGAHRRRTDPPAQGG